MSRKEDIHHMATEMSKKLADEGRLIEAGWVGYRAMVMSPDAPQIQINECKIAFMAGAQHLFASIMVMLDPGAEPSLSDLKKMELIDKELRTIAHELELMVTEIKGKA